MVINGKDFVLAEEVEKYIKDLEAKILELEPKVLNLEKKIATFDLAVEQEAKVELAKVGGWIHAKADNLKNDFVGAENFVGKLLEGLGKHMQRPAVAVPAPNPVAPPVTPPPPTP
jgi:hypothetical protein